jgi:hypothetical protein
MKAKTMNRRLSVALCLGSLTLPLLVGTAFGGDVVPPAVAPAQTPPTTFQLTIAPSDDRQAVVISMPPPPKTLSEIRLPGNVVDGFIGALGAARAQVIPPIPQRNPEPGQQLHVANPGRWFIQRHPDGNGFDVAILDPGFGWVVLRLTGEEGRLFEQTVHQNLSPQ